MKSFSLLCLLSIFALNGNAQLMVDSTGNVGIGNVTTPLSPLSVGGIGDSAAVVSIFDSAKKEALKTLKLGDKSTQYGVF